MKIIIAHNRYALPDRGSGEEVMVDAIANLLTEKGHTIIPFVRTSLDISRMKFGKFRAFFSGIYSRKTKIDFSKILIIENPDVVFVQNVFPLISPSILAACNKLNIPVVMRCPNYRLVCPNGLFMRNGKVCELCINGHEYNCIIHNCEEDIFKSTGYALRNYVARKFSFFKNNVDVFMALTEFARRKFIENGFTAERIRVISGLADLNLVGSVYEETDGEYIGFAGRVSHEKGIDLIINAAEMLPHIPFRIAGKYDGFETTVQSAPDNVNFLGQLEGKELNQFYNHSRMIVMPSKWYEGLPAVIIEAMLHVKPIICSDLGGLPEIVHNKETGLLFKHNNVNDFVDKVLKLWNDPGMCRKYGSAGRRKAEEKYHPDAFYERLMNGFKDAIENKKAVR